jgi:hypothetical protein
MSLQITYELAGRGWARVTLADNDQTCTLFVSFLSDALGDLLSALNMLLEGRSNTTCAMQAEPGEYRWVMECSGDQLHLQVLRFDRNFSDRANEDGKLLFEAICPIHHFVRRIKMTLDNLLDTHGVSGYRAEWVNHDFPMPEYERLVQWLDQRKGPVGVQR